MPADIRQDADRSDFPGIPMMPGIFNGRGTGPGLTKKRCPCMMMPSKGKDGLWQLMRKIN
jgi:hypothetical protein